MCICNFQSVQVAFILFLAFSNKMDMGKRSGNLEFYSSKEIAFLIVTCSTENRCMTFRTVRFFNPSIVTRKFQLKVNVELGFFWIKFHLDQIILIKNKMCIEQLAHFQCRKIFDKVNLNQRISVLAFMSRKKILWHICEQKVMPLLH